MKSKDFLSYKGFNTDDPEELSTIAELYSLLVDRDSENESLLNFIIDQCNKQKDYLKKKAELQQQQNEKK